MNRLLPVIFLAMAVSASGQENVRRALDDVLAHDEYVTLAHSSERTDPESGALLKRNQEYRLVLPSEEVPRLVAAFEADRDRAYTYVRTSAEYNRVMLSQRAIEMRLQNDVRLDGNSTQYSYVLMNTLNTADTRFRTTTIFLWKPEREGRVDARVYILYGERPTVTERTATASAGCSDSGMEPTDMPFLPTDIERQMAAINTSVRREMIERAPDTGRLLSYIRSVRIGNQDVGRVKAAFRNERKHAYTYQESLQKDVSSYRLTVVLDTMRMAYVMTLRDTVSALHAIYGALPYSERKSDLVADPKAVYTIANKGSGKYLAMDAARNAVTADEPCLFTLQPVGYHFMIRSGGLALADLRKQRVDGNYQLSFVDAEPNDPRQLWTVVRQGECYNLINVATKQTANLANGNKAAGAPIVSYVTNERNATSNNRLFMLTPSPPSPPAPLPKGRGEIESIFFRDNRGMRE